MKKRNYRVIHDSYITEYLGITYPPGTWRTNVPLGDAKQYELKNITPSEAKFIKKPFRPVADAIVIYNGEVHIIEAKIREERGKLEQLLLYEYLFPRTPEYQAYKNWKIRKILVTPKDQGAFEAFLQKYGIEVKYYRPLWIIEYLDTLDRRYQRGHYYSVEF